MKLQLGDVCNPNAAFWLFEKLTAILLSTAPWPRGHFLWSNYPEKRNLAVTHDKASSFGVQFGGVLAFAICKPERNDSPVWWAECLLLHFASFSLRIYEKSFD